MKFWAVVRIKMAASADWLDFETCNIVLLICLNAL